MHDRFLGLMVIGCLLCVGSALKVEADTALQGITPGSFITLNDTTDMPRTFGWSFIPSSPITVDALGVLDLGADGLTNPIEVGLWSDDGSALLVSALVPAGSTSPLISGFRYQPVAPVALLGGQTYVLGSTFAKGGERGYFNVPAFSTSPHITYVRARSGDVRRGFSYPFANAGILNGVFGPNFSFSPGATPEPGPVVFAAGILLAGAFTLRRRHARSCGPHRT
jgi:hypothetical protein